MDADLSHDPKYLPDLAAALDRFDLVIGSRYLDGVSVVNWPLHRIMLSAFANRYIRMVTGLRAHDCTSGYRVWRRDALARLPLDGARANGYAFLTEMLFEASRAGCAIGEVPIVFVERAGRLLEGLARRAVRIAADAVAADRARTAGSRTAPPDPSCVTSS